jgi:predicted nucleic acid-binding protein
MINTVDSEVLLKLWPDKISDFGDAIVAVVCKAEKGARIVTFDEKFIRALHAMGLNSASL